MIDSCLIFPNNDEILEVLASKTAKQVKTRGGFFEASHMVRNMRLRLVILQSTIDGIDVVDVMVTPAENKTTDVFGFLEEK